MLFFFFQAEDGIRDATVTGVQTCALPIYARLAADEHARLSWQRRLYDPREIGVGDGAAGGVEEHHGNVVRARRMATRELCFAPHVQIDRVRPAAQNLRGLLRRDLRNHRAASGRLET